MSKQRSKLRRPSSRVADEEDGDSEALYRAKAARTRRLKKLKKARLKQENKERAKNPTPGQLRQRQAMAEGRVRPKDPVAAGKKGGRPPDEWKRMLGRLVNRPSTIKALKKVLRNEEHGAWFGAFKFSAEQTYGKAKESLDVTGKLTLEDILSRSREEEGHGSS